MKCFILLPDLESLEKPSDLRMVFSKALLSDRLRNQHESLDNRSLLLFSTCIKAKESTAEHMKHEIENGKVCPACSSLVTLFTETLVQKFIARTGQQEMQLIKRT